MKNWKPWHRVYSLHLLRVDLRKSSHFSSWELFLMSTEMFHFWTFSIWTKTDYKIIISGNPLNFFTEMTCDESIFDCFMNTVKRPLNIHFTASLSGQMFVYLLCDVWSMITPKFPFEYKEKSTFRNLTLATPIKMSKLQSNFFLCDNSYYSLRFCTLEINTKVEKNPNHLNELDRLNSET